ncbi:tyrosine-type recombinase/integrase [Janibacter sp. G1551]|uniref:tyrosine-type recombinase/integrase n=1 Tax=Janibacter sp. G1551 TaxID=3420440 RepID=UPI003D035034
MSRVTNARDRLAAVADDRLPTLVIGPGQQPPEREPYAVYLGQLSGETERTMRGCLDRVARILAGVRLDEPSADEIARGVSVVTGAQVPWWELRYDGTSALRAVMLDIGWSPSHVNKHLSALRRVLKESWRLGLMDAEAYHRAIDLEPVKGTREPAGRDVAEDELAALLTACDDSPLGVRDAAVIAVLYVTGIRRSEAAALTLVSYSARTRSLRLVGKGNKERIVPLSQAALPWLEAWLRLRGAKPGPLFCPVRKGGKIALQPVTAQTIADLLERRRRRAGLAQPVKPHDLRRTVIGDLLDNGTDLATAQALAGHADPRTTARYDRRPLDTKRDAVDGLHLPPPPGGGT